MQRGAIAAAVTAVALLLPARLAMGADCAGTKDQGALRMRAVQTEFMVAALTCEERDRYNAFVTKFRPQLVREGKNLQAYFRRVHGKQATVRLNRLVTQLANLSSARSIADRAQYCAAAKDRLIEVLALEPTELADFVARQPATPLPDVTFCAVAAAKP